jgi:RNA polymerase sigma-70 factor (ECF subfamily)
VSDALDNWFKREVLVHEAALLRYLNRAWRHRDDVHDLRQEIYARVYEAAAVSRPQSPKSFLFATARNLLADRVRRGRIVSIEAVGDSEALNVLVDELSPERRLSSWQEMRRVAQALNRLPPRCRDVVWLRKVDELPTREVARHMGVSERTVEGQVLKGMRLLTDAIFGGALPAAQAGGVEASGTETGHGEQ